MHAVISPILKKTTIFNILVFPPATMLSLFPCIEKKKKKKTS